jgi:plastocyanin
MFPIGGMAVASIAGAAMAVSLAACGESATPSNTAASGAGSAGVNIGSPTVHVAASDDLKFTPAAQDAQVGDIVQWSNTGMTGHTVTFDNFSSLSDVSLQGGSTWEVKFARAGTYSYRCTIHPQMTGTITVH